jgi:PAS domain S-box-containing protein
VTGYVDARREPLNTLDAQRIATACTMPAVGESADGRVIACNEAATELLGYSCREIIGRGFLQVFRPRDIFDNPLRYDSSLFLGLLRQGKPIRNFECAFRRACGEYRLCSVSLVTVVGPTPLGHQFVYVLWPVLRRRHADEVIGRLLNDDRSGSGTLGEGLRRTPPDGSGPLTRRQLEVLRQVAAGLSTAEIAATLYISSETVRNHIRNIFERLGVHSRAEAVSAALRRHLI